MNRKKLNVLIGFAICFCTCVSVFLLTRILPYGAQNNFADSPDGNLTAVEWIQNKQPGTSLTPTVFSLLGAFLCCVAAGFLFYLLYRINKSGTNTKELTEKQKARRIKKELEAAQRREKKMEAQLTRKSLSQKPILQKVSDTSSSVDK